jgi:hypothetical protein
MPDVRPKALTLGPLLRDTMQLFALHWRRHLVLSFLCAVPLAILYAAGYFDPLIGFIRAVATQPEARDVPAGASSMTVTAPVGSIIPPLRSLSLVGLTLMAVSAYAAPWWAGLFELARPGPAPARQRFDDFIAVLARLALVGVVMLLVVFAIEFAGQVLILVLAPLLRQVGAAAFAQFIILTLLVIVQQGIWIRLLISVPSALWGEPMPIVRSWSASAGATLNLGAAVIILALPSLTLAMVVVLPVLQSLAAAGPILNALTVILLGPLLFLYHALQLTLAAVAFRALREARRL